MKKNDLLEILLVLWRKIWIIALAFVICAVAGFSYSAFYAVPRYKAQSALIVTTGGIIDARDDGTVSKISTGEINTSFDMLETYSYSLRMLEFYEGIAKSLEGKTQRSYTGRQLRSMTSVSYADKALIIKINCEGSIPNDVILITKMVADAAPEHLKKIFPTTTAIVSEYANEASLTYPNDMLFTLGGGLIGAVLAALIIYIIAVRDNTVKSEDDLTEYGFGVLGFVPDFNDARGGGYYYYRE